MTVRPIHDGPGWWLDGPPDAVAAIAPTLRYAGPDPLFIPVPSLVRPDDPLGDPGDRRLFVITPETLHRENPTVPAPFHGAVALQLADADPWPDPDPRVGWWVVSPARWPDAHAPARTAHVRLLATGPVPGPHCDPADTPWTLGDWLATLTPFAPDLEEV